MAWNKNKLELNSVMHQDIPDMNCINPNTISSILDWILEDRKQSPQWKAEVRLKRKQNVKVKDRKDAANS